MNKKIKNTAYTKEPVNQESNNSYFEFIVIVCIIGYLAIDFLPAFKSIDTDSVQFLYLSLLNVIIGIYFYYNSFFISEKFIFIYKKYLVVKLYLVFLILCGISIFLSRNFYLGIVSFSKMVIIFVTLIHFTVLLHNRLHLIYKIAFIVSISVFLQSYRDLYNFIQASKLDSIVAALTKLKGNTGNINIFSASLCSKVPFLLIGIVHFTRWKKWFFVVTLLLASVLIWLSGSRAAYLSLFIVMLFFIIFYLKLNFIKKETIFKLSYIVLPVMFSFLIANQIFEMSKDAGRYQSVTGRLSKVADFKENSTSMRFAIWNNAVTIIEKNPFFGVGLGNWEIESIPYETKIVDGDNISHHPHNDFLEITAETGVLNGMVYVLMFVILTYTNLRRILKSKETRIKKYFSSDEMKKRVYFVNSLSLVSDDLKKINKRFSEEKETKIVALLAFLFTISYGIDSFFNFPLYRPTMQLGFCFLLALTIVNEPTPEVFNEKYFNTKLIPILTIIISVITTYFSFKTFKAYQLVTDLYSEILSANYTLTADELVRSLPKYPNVYNGEPFANYVGNYFIIEKKYKQAEKYINLGNKINPYIGKTEYYKSIIAKETGKIDSANFYIRKALEIRPRYVNYYYEAINLAVLLKDTTALLQIHKIYTRYNNSSDIWGNTSIGLAQCKYDNKRLISFIDAGLKKFPGDSILIERRKTYSRDFYMNKAYVFYQKLEYSKALKLYKMAFIEDPINVTLLQNIGLCYYNLKQYTNAVFYFKKSLNFPSPDGKSEYFLGVCYLETGDKENGCKYLTVAQNKKYANAQEIRTLFCR